MKHSTHVQQIAKLSGVPASLVRASIYKIGNTWEQELASFLSSPLKTSVKNLERAPQVISFIKKHKKQLTGYFFDRLRIDAYYFDEIGCSWLSVWAAINKPVAMERIAVYHAIVNNLIRDIATGWLYVEDDNEPADR